jgi:hypothetical protein
MSIVILTRASYQVDTVAFDGTNHDEIIALVGANAVERIFNPATGEKNRINVFGTEVAVGELVPVMHGTMTPPGGGRKIAPGDPEYTE